jgi:hypothetical protein
MHSLHDYALTVVLSLLPVRLHANSVTYKQSHIEYLRPIGAKTTLKLAPSHFMVRLTSPDVTKGSTAASLQDCKCQAVQVCQ